MKHHMGNNPTSIACKFGLKLFVFELTVLLTIWLSSGLAQVPPPITPSGLNTQVNLSASPPAGKVQYDITGGTRPGGGTNLFHSFGNFNVPNNNIANFLNDAALPTTNILGRVTGGNISNIFGTIQTTGFGNANLFLMNPAGFLFGPNATLNVGGMVSFSSADYLRLADGKLFHALPNEAADALLTTAPVAAYGFLGSNPGAITVQGSQLTVTPGTGISLVGGNIAVQNGTLDTGAIQAAKLSAPGGQIQLASVASPGEVQTGNLNYAPNVNGQSFGALGSINISQQSVIDVSGNGGGTVLIRGGNFVLDNSTISANVTGSGPLINGVESIGRGIDIQVSQNAIIQNGEVIETNVLGNVTPGVTYGGVQVKADHIELIGAPPLPPLFPFSGIRSDVGTDTQPTISGGNSGSISLEANSIVIKGVGSGNLETRVVGSSPVTPVPGNAGNITVTADQDIQLNNSSINSNIFFGSGTGGNITLTSRHGNILETGNAIPPNFAPIPGQPFPSFTFNIITNQTTQGSPGNTGNITLNAPEGQISLAGAVIGIGVAGTGTPGVFQANAKSMTLNNFSTIQMDNFSPQPARPFDLTISENLTLNNSRIITTARGPAQAADLNITAHDVHVTGMSSLSTETRSVGNAGHLTISTESLEVTNGGQITSGTAQNPPIVIPGVINITFPPPTGAGGTITVQGVAGSGSSASSVLIDGVGSGIFTNTVGIGAAGNTNITAQSVTIQNGGAISAATSGTAPSATGGSITVNAQQVALNSQATITAETNGIAPAGVVDINTGTLMINSGGQIRSSSGDATQPVRALSLSPSAAQPLTGGTITVQGQTGSGSQAGSVTIDGAGSGIFTQSSGNRPGGDITINANQLQVNSGGLISAATTGAGAGGSVNINVGGTYSSNAGSVSSTATQATGGDINILTSGSVTMTNGASISASSTGAGNAGNIQINAGNQLLMTNSSVTTEATQSGGGLIKITTTPSGGVQLTNSKISASVLDGNGGGGSVNIDPQFVVLQNSQILAQAVQGPGGNISITTNLLLPDSTSIISASSQFGQQGTVAIQSPIAPAGGKVFPLTQKPLLATTLLGQRCAALAGGNISSFTVAGRDSLPAEPGGWLSSPLALATTESADGTVKEASSGTSESETTEAPPLLSLRHIAPPGFLTQSFAVDSSGCQS